MTRSADIKTAAEGAATGHPRPELLWEQRFEARLGTLKQVRASVLAAARHCGFDDVLARDIVLAVDEACKNVIVHAYHGVEGEGDIVLSVFESHDGLAVQVRDFAPPVDPARIVPRDLRDIRPGQLGTHFMREIMDSNEYMAAPDGAGNLLLMTKRRD